MPPPWRALHQRQTTVAQYLAGESVPEDGSSPRHVLFQAALAAICHNSLLQPSAKRLKEHGKAHKLIIIAVERRLVVAANALLKTAMPGKAVQTQLPGQLARRRAPEHEACRVLYGRARLRRAALTGRRLWHYQNHEGWSRAQRPCVARS